MDEKTLRTIEFLNNYERNDIEENLKQYREIIGVVMELNDYVHESKITMAPWKSYLGTMLQKSALHGYTLSTIVGGQEMEIDYLSKKGINRKIIDISSSYVLLRSHLETFLMIDFIYFQPKREAESRFRYMCWEYSSLKSASKYSTKDKPVIAKYIEKNEPKIMALWEEIEKSPYFKKQYRKTLKHRGDSKLGYRWNDLIKLSKLTPLLFDNLYSLLSKHAHSESAGIFHLKNTQLGYHKNHKDGYIPLFLSKCLTCLTILRLKDYIKIVDIKFNTLSSRLRNDIEIYGRFIDKDFMPSKVIKP